MSIHDLPVGTVTFLFSDIEGSTRLLQALGRDAYADALEAHNKIIRDLAGAAVVSTEGDSFFCAFATPSEAVAVAVDSQLALAAHRWPEGFEVRVRMGLHTGEGVLGGDNYVGLDVHKAARISSAAHGGQVLVSDATRGQVADRLGDGVGLRDLGEHRLKDLAQPEHLHQLVISGVNNEFPAPNSAEAPTNLPDHLSSFVGRRAELEKVADSLAASRLVTLTGSGGSGKTRLAIEAGRDQRTNSPGGVYFAALGNLDDPSLLGAHVATELSVSEQVGRAIEDTLIDYFRTRRALLLLDNCEHVADAAADLVERLLRGCADLTILATSREPLLLQGERLIEVGPLQMPTEGPGEGALESDAVRLFAARAVESSADFDAGAWVTDIVEICSRLDGIPLAIELAAARIGMLSPADIVSRLEDRFALLTTRSRSAEPRQRTLEAAIDWSYDLLGDDAQQLLRSLSLFRGGFTLDAVREVCFDESVGVGLVLDQLTELREKSLLTQQTGFGGTRFGLLETIREYGYVRLHREGEYEAAERRHRDYYTGVARTQALRLGTAEQLDALALLEADHDNLRAVMRRAVAGDDYEAAVGVAGWLAWFWYIHAHFTEGERWSLRLLGSLPDEPSRAWLRLLLGSAQYDFRIGNYDRSQSRLETALRAAQAAGLARYEMWAYAYMATNELYQVHVDEARRDAEKAVDLAGRVGDFIAQGYSSYVLVGVDAWVSAVDQRVDADKARELLGRLEPLSAGARAVGDRNIIGHIVQLEGMLAASIGDRARAAAAFDEAVTALTELGTVGCACHCLEAMADYAVLTESHEAAARLIGASDRLRSDIGISVAPVEERLRANVLESLDEALTDHEREAAFGAGSELSLAEAAQLARQTVALG